MIRAGSSPCGELGAICRATGGEARPSRHPMARGQSGSAFPITALTLVIVSAVAMGFATMAATEPTIAHNQLRTIQARALAEAGVERAIWALNNPDDRLGIPPAFAAAPAPYDGSQFVIVPGASAPGGFRVTVANGATSYERTITALGWAPGESASGPKAVQKITVTALNARLIVRDPPAAVAVRGDLHIGANTVVDARADRSCGAKVATLSLGQTSFQGTGQDLRGASDDATRRNQVTDAGGGAVPGAPGDAVTNVAPAAFDFLLTDADLNALRGLARMRGTYLQGAVIFDASRPMPDGLIFIDTVSGRNVTAERATPATADIDLASAIIGDGAAAGPTGTWSGWLIVNGSVSIRTDARLRGFVHAQGSLSYEGPGTGGLSGAMVSGGIGPVPPPAGGAGAASDIAITYDCEAVRTGGGTVAGRWAIKTGSYKESSGS